MKKTALLLLLLVSAAYGYALKPDRNYINTPDKLGISYKEHDVVTSDKYSIKVWQCFPSSDNDKKTTLVVAYGDAGNMSYWLEQTRELVSKGFTVVLFDYRGFGKSSDFEMDYDYLYYNEFAIDLATVVNWAQNNMKDNKTGIWALSMGTIMTTIALERVKPDFIIAEGYVVSPVVVQQKLKELKKKNVLLPKEVDKYEPNLKKIQVPILLFAGKQDVITTADDSKMVEEINPLNKLVLFDGNHLQGFKVLSGSGYGDKYIGAIFDFIKH